MATKDVSNPEVGGRVRDRPPVTPTNKTTRNRGTQSCPRSTPAKIIREDEDNLLDELATPGLVLQLNLVQYGSPQAKLRPNLGSLIPSKALPSMVSERVDERSKPVPSFSHTLKADSTSSETEVDTETELGSVQPGRFAKESNSLELEEESFVVKPAISNTRSLRSAQTLKTPQRIAASAEKQIAFHTDDKRAKFTTVTADVQPPRDVDNRIGQQDGTGTEITRRSSRISTRKASIAQEHRKPQEGDDDHKKCDGDDSGSASTVEETQPDVPIKSLYQHRATRLRRVLTVPETPNESKRTRTPRETNKRSSPSTTGNPQEDKIVSVAREDKQVGMAKSQSSKGQGSFSVEIPAKKVFTPNKRNIDRSDFFDLSDDDNQSPSKRAKVTRTYKKTPKRIVRTKDSFLS
ncbi:hypothetical protein EDC01DRAFT_636278 [Geopyxis carbonaria]|nr:hypothetical protein EDC01DRAFT_636278 [Geopyxis carbonaria]